MNTPITPRRPRTVTIAGWGVFLIGAWNAGRALALARQSDLLLALEVTPDPRFRLVMAVGWALLFWGTGVALRQKRPFTRQAIPLFLTLYALYELGLLFFFATEPRNQPGWLLQGSLYITTILATQWALNRPAADAYFCHEEGYEPQD